MKKNKHSYVQYSNAWRVITGAIEESEKIFDILLETQHHYETFFTG